MTWTRSSILALAVTISIALPGAAQEALPEGPAKFEGSLVKLSQHVRARTVLVYGLIGLGSGAVVDHGDEQVIVTNAHVVAAARYAIVQWADGSSVLCRRKGIDYGRDLAVLVPEKPLPKKVPSFEFAPKRPQVGAWVVACGFPGGLRTTSVPTFSLGRVTGENPKGGAQVMGMLDYSGAIRSDVAIFSGNSGGPMLDLKGRLLGINGAVDLEKAASMTIPIETVQERLRTLQGDVIVLPNGTRLDPATNSFVKRLFQMLDPMSRKMPEQIRKASKQAAEATKRLPQRPQGPLTEEDPNDRLANVARKSPRQKLLATAFAAARPAALRTAEGDYATVIGPRHAIVKASSVGATEQLTFEGGLTGKVLARSPEDDLALVRLSQAQAPVAPDAPVRPVGTLICVGGASQDALAFGVVSVEARRTSSQVLSRIQGGGSPVGGALKTIERLAKMFKIESLQQLLAQIRKSIEMREAFAGGTDPRDYVSVLSIDAPLPPSAVGAPVYDRLGRRVGVAVGVAHHGTSYVVPMERVRRAFRTHLRPRTGKPPAETTPIKPAKPVKPAKPRTDDTPPRKPAVPVPPKPEREF